MDEKINPTAEAPATAKPVRNPVVLVQEAVEDGVHLVAKATIVEDGKLDRNTLFRATRTVGNGDLHFIDLVEKLPDGTEQTFATLTRNATHWTYAFSGGEKQVERSATKRPTRKGKANAEIDPGPDALKAVTACIRDLKGDVIETAGRGGGGKAAKETKAMLDTLTQLLAAQGIDVAALLAQAKAKEGTNPNPPAPSTAPDDRRKANAEARKAARER